MTVSDVIREEVVTADPATPVEEVAETMEREAVGSVVVVEGDAPTGIVTDRDLAMDVVAAGADPAALTAADVMTADPFTVDADAGIYDALEAASEADVRRIPVVDADGSLAGIVTLDDFTVLLSSELANVADVIVAESPPY